MVQNKSRLRGLQIKSPDPARWRDARTRRANTTYNPKPFQTYIRPGSRWAAGTAAGRSGRAGWAGGRLASFCRWPLTWLDSRGPTGWRRGVCTLDVWRSREKEETVVSNVQTCVLTLFPSQPSHIFHKHFRLRFTSHPLRARSLTITRFTQLIITRALSLDLVIIYLSAHLVITKTLINISDGVSLF